MSFPRFYTCPFVILAMRLYHGYKGLNLHPIEVFMKRVKNNIEKLLRILLFFSCKLLLESTQNTFKVYRNDYRLVTKPHFFNQLRICYRDQPLRAERIGAVDLFDEVTSQEVIRKGFAMTQALNGAVHITGVCQILKASKPSFSISKLVVFENALINPLLVILNLKWDPIFNRLNLARAFVFMEFNVFFLTI